MENARKQALFNRESSENDPKDNNPEVDGVCNFY